VDPPVRLGRGAGREAARPHRPDVVPRQLDPCRGGLRLGPGADGRGPVRPRCPHGQRPCPRHGGVALVAAGRRGPAGRKRTRERRTYVTTEEKRLTRSGLIRAGAVSTVGLYLAGCGSSGKKKAASTGAVGGGARKSRTVNMLTWSDHYAND